VIPATVDDLAANGLLEDSQTVRCWQRATETVNARKNALSGLAVASEERIEAFLLYIKDGVDAEIVAAGPSTGLGAGGGAHLQRLLVQLCAQGIRNLRFPKVHPAEMSMELLEALGFRPVAGYVLFAGKAQSG
jgi:hypothetical protein